MEQWFQLVEFADSIAYFVDCDALVWQLENKGIYSTSSLYHVINFRGIQSIFVPVVWNLRVSQKSMSFSIIQVWRLNLRTVKL